MYRFGHFRLDVQRRVLVSEPNGQKVELTPKSIELLLILIEHAGELVSKQTLLDEVWPNVIVEENSLTRTVSMLRRGLGESPEEHRYIATVPGRGYRFVARVKEEFKTPDASEKQKNPLRVKTWMVVVSVIVLISAIFMYGRPQKVNLEAPRQQHLKLTHTALVLSATGNHSQPTLSPDGSRVAFINDASGVPQVFVKHLAAGDPIQLTHGNSASGSPSWSPRDDRILYHIAGQGIWSIDPMGTLVPRQIIRNGRNPSHSWDGSNITYESGGEVWLADADGSGQHSVLNAPRNNRIFSDAYPSMAPDGEHLVMFQHAVGPMGDYWIVPLDGGEARQVTHDLQWGGKPTWTPDGKLVFPSKRGGTTTLWQVTLNGEEPEPVTAGLGADRDPVVSRDGEKLLYTSTRSNSSLIVTDPESREEETLYQNRRLVAFPRVSPDGRSVTFFAEIDPREQIMVMNVDGSDIRQLTEYRSHEANIMPRFSPDSRWIYYYQNLPPASLRRIALDGGPYEMVFGEFGWEKSADAELHPSGNQIAFVRKLDQDGSQFVIKDVDTGRESEPPFGIVFSPVWSRDGQALLGTAPNSVLICVMTHADCTVIIDDSSKNLSRAGVEPERYYAQWSWDESRIFYTRWSDVPLYRSLLVVNRDGTGARHLFDYGPVHPLAGRFQVMPGDRILWVKYEQEETELVQATINRTSN